MLSEGVPPFQEELVRNIVENKINTNKKKWVGREPFVLEKAHAHRDLLLSPLQVK